MHSEQAGNGSGAECVVGTTVAVAAATDPRATRTCAGSTGPAARSSSP